MARMSVVLAVLLIVGLIGVGIAQEFIDLPESSLAGAVVAEPQQRDINLCMNACMRACVVDIEDNTPCTGVCEQECGVTHS